MEALYRLAQPILWTGPSGTRYSFTPGARTVIAERDLATALELEAGGERALERK